MNAVPKSVQAVVLELLKHGTTLQSLFFRYGGADIINDFSLSRRGHYSQKPSHSGLTVDESEKESPDRRTMEWIRNMLC